MSRECGKCSLCCKLLDVEQPGDFISPAGYWCKHCNLGATKPCRIYGQKRRPPECSGFECGWIHNETIPEKFRPDQCGIVVGRMGRKIILILDPETPHLWKRPEVADLVGQMVDATWVLVKYKSKVIDLRANFDQFLDMLQKETA